MATKTRRMRDSGLFFLYCWRPVVFDRNRNRYYFGSFWCSGVALRGKAIITQYGKRRKSLGKAKQDAEAISINLLCYLYDSIEKDIRSLGVVITNEE